MNHLLTILLLTAFVSIVINALLRRYDFPPIIGYIFAGAFVTHQFALHESGIHALHEIAEFGIAFLMFTIGLEFSVEQFRKLKKEVFLFGSLQVILSTLLFGAAAKFIFALSLAAAFVVGSALALSSTAIVLKILNETHEIRKPYGRIVLGILLFQDLAVIPILLMLTLFSADASQIGSLITTTLLGAVAVVALLYLGGRYLVEPFLGFVFDARSHELFIGSVLFIAIGVSYVAHLFGFSYSLGAFIGGMLLAETHYKHQIEADLTPFRDLLLGLFFVTVGMQISLVFLMANLGEILLIVIAVMLLKAALIFGILITQAPKDVSLRSAVTLSQVGEFSFVVLELARIGGITTMPINQTLVIAVVFSMLLTPFILKKLHQIVQLLIPQTGSPIQAPVSDHIIVIGYGSLGRQVCRTLRQKGLLYVAVDSRRDRVKKSVELGDPCILGNAHQPQILEQLDVRNAVAVIVAIERDEETHAVVEAIHHGSASAQIVVTTRDNDSVLPLDKRIRSCLYEHKAVAEGLVEKAMTCDVG